MDASAEKSAFDWTVIVFTWIVSLVVASFYILSSAGWFLASYLALTGALGDEGTLLAQNLSVLDHFMRTLQVILIVIACAFLLLRRHEALPCFLASLGFSLATTLFLGNWGVSFLTGLLSFTLLALATAYVYWLFRRKVLH
jgi:hypothetical protein